MCINDMYTIFFYLDGTLFPERSENVFILCFGFRFFLPRLPFRRSYVLFLYRYYSTVLPFFFFLRNSFTAYTDKSM